MQKIANILIKGIAAVLPVGLTVYLVYWLGTSIEHGLRPVITAVLPASYYVPGMGLAAGFVLLFFVGVAVNAWVVRRVLQLGERLLERIPLVKSVYGGLRDFTDYFSAAQERSDLQRVVAVAVGDIRLLGFLTSESVRDLPLPGEGEDIVAVYFPMSYQIGGYTVYLPRSRLEMLDMPVEDAMRRVLTAGLSGQDGPTGAARPRGAGAD